MTAATHLAQLAALGIALQPEGPITRSDIQLDKQDEIREKDSLSDWVFGADDDAPDWRDWGEE